MMYKSSSRNRRYGGTIEPFILVIVLIASGIGYGAWKLIPSGAAEGPEVITCAVELGTFEYDVVERGEVESSSNVEVRCEVRAQKSSSITILDVVDEGTNVQPGDVLVRLDSSGLEQDLIQQQINCNSAEAQMITAKNNFEAAQIAMKEYVEGTFFQEEQEIQGEIFIAEENLRRAKEYLAYSERLSARGYVTPQQLEGDRFAVEKARTELKAAKTKLRVLQEYTKPKTLKQLESDIKSAEAAWKADESSQKLELAKLKDIEVQIEKCVLRAPQAGQVIHANETGRRGDSEFIVEPGASVREGQAIIRLPESGKMQVKAKVNESRITDLQEGLLATIRIDAFGDKTFQGKVIRVNEYPEPNSWYSSQVKEYGCFIQILDVDDTLKPGLTAEATIHVTHVKNATKVPVQAVHEHGRKTYCMLHLGETKWEARELKIAANNENFVLVESGVQAGDIVAMNPRAVLEFVDLPAIVDEPDQRQSREGPKNGRVVK